MEIFSQESKKILPGCLFSCNGNRLNLSISGPVVKLLLTSLIQRLVFLYLMKKTVAALTGWVVEPEVRYSHSDKEMLVTLKVCSGISQCMVIH